MSERNIILEGYIKQFVKSESGNIAFMLEDAQGSLHYCFSPSKKPLISLSDKIAIIGSELSGNKVRINYILNKTRNSEDNLIETKKDWLYYLALSFAIIVTGGFIFALLFTLGIFPMQSSSMWGSLSYIFNFVFSILLVILFLPLMIILWVLTFLFSKKRSKESALEIEIENMKNLIREKTTISPQIKPSELIQMEEKGIPNEGQLIGKIRYCAHCGEKLPSEAQFCPKCGSKW